MNIASGNPLAALVAQPSAEVKSQPVTDQALPAGFTESFLEQLKLLGTGNNQGELIKSFQTKTNLSNQNELQNLSAMVGNPADMQKLADLLGKELPVSYKVGDDTDLQSVLSALESAFKPTNNNETQTEKTALQNLNETLNPAQAEAAKPESGTNVAELMSAIEGQNLQTSKEPSITKSANLIVIKNESRSKNMSDVDNKQESSVELPQALYIPVMAPVTPLSPQAAMPSVSGDLPSVNRQPSSELLMNNLAQNNNLDLTNTDTGKVPTNLLQNKPVNFQSEDNKLLFNMNSYENINAFDQNGPSKSDVAFAGDNSLLKGINDIGQPLLNKNLTEIKAEIPAMARTISHPEWNTELGEKILWMNNRSVPSAEIKLNPEHLGPISVRIDVNQDQASISFTAQHSSVREALEASIPKLREMMGTQQLNLIDVNVAQHFSSNQERSQPQNFAQSASSNQETMSSAAEAIEKPGNEQIITSNGLLSIYA